MEDDLDYRFRMLQEGIDLEPLPPSNVSLDDLENQLNKLVLADKRRRNRAASKIQTGYKTRQAKKRLALSSSLNPHLGKESALKYLPYDLYEKITQGGAKNISAPQFFRGMILVFIFGQLLRIGMMFFLKGTDVKDVYTSENISLSQEIGLQLLRYDQSVADAYERVNQFHKFMTPYTRNKNLLSYELSLNSNNTLHDLDSYTPSEFLYSIPSDSLEQQLYENRLLVQSMKQDWRPDSNKLSDISLSIVDDMNLLLATFMPPIQTMSRQTPSMVYFSGGTVDEVVRYLATDSFHQDTDRFSVLGPYTTDHDYRIMIFEQDPEFDQEWTQFSPEIDGIRASKYIKHSFTSYNYAKVIQFDIYEADYMAIIFDNNRIFHRTPPISFYQWLTNTLPSTRRIKQLRIAWDDRDQIDYSRDIEEIRGGRNKNKNHST